MIRASRAGSPVVIELATVFEFATIEAKPRPETVLMLTRDEKLFAVASLAVLVTHVLGDTGEPTLGAGNLGLGVPPRLLGARLDVVVQHSLRLGQDLFGRASGLRVTGKFPTGALGEQAQQFHRIQYRSFS